MKRFFTFLKTELKLSLRDMNMVIFAIIMPLVIFIILGIIYGTKPAYDADCSTMYSPNRITGGISADSPLTAYVLIWCADELNRHGFKEKFVVPSIGKYGAGGLHWEAQ